MGIRLFEHTSIAIRFEEDGESLETNDLIISSTQKELFQKINSKPFNNNKNSHCFIIKKQEKGLKLVADYCIGLDWLGNTGRYLYVEPKINALSTQKFVFQSELNEEEIGKKKFSGEDKTFFELDYLQMLLQITSIPESESQIKDLITIDWEAKQIAIAQKEDRLTPFLVIRFLQTLKTIVRKGLKKKYYKVQENLNNRVKGRILVGQHIKQNIFKNKFTSTFCEYQQFDIDHTENRFLKKVLQFATSYVESNKEVFGKNYVAIQNTIQYCRPSFELISNEVKDFELKHIKHNSFYKDYATALHLGKQLLKRFAYTITQTTQTTIDTPPFWIDMPRLFELYVYSKMIEANPTHKNEIVYQFSTYGNELDILVTKPNFQMIIDAKYKLRYKDSHLHQDIRQVAGYARLNKVRNKLNRNDDTHIDCLIIYPDLQEGKTDFSLEAILQNRNKIGPYHKVYKLGVKLPQIDKNDGNIRPFSNNY
ncbi:restriction endonuclease [Flavobacterium columnare]|nr:restriction endonuclease [Flavobacterium columnare]